jgi:nucleotide-binding universal stress UspA family protein
METQATNSETRAGTSVIVVGYDGLEESRGAVDAAAELAGSDGTLVIVHVTEPVSPLMGKAYYKHAVETSRCAARRSVDELTQVGLGVAAIEPEVIEGDPADQLIRIAQEWDADGIVVGSRGRGRIRAFLGSVSHRLLEKADRPVVIVPSPTGGF